MDGASSALLLGRRTLVCLPSVRLDAARIRVISELLDGASSVLLLGRRTLTYLDLSSLVVQ